MKVLNIGSLNLDYVYSVDHMVKAGETLDSTSMEIFVGGKGLNQSSAIAKAGVEVYHAGLIGEGGQLFLDTCDKYGINKKYIKFVEGNSGHAIIQLDKQGQNCILIYGGTNQMLTKSYVDEVLKDFEENDIVILQNEINEVPYIINKAYEKGMKIILNPSPFNKEIIKWDLKKITFFIMNEIEGEEITGEKSPEKIIEHMKTNYQSSKVLLTLGEKGSVFFDGDTEIHQEIYKTEVVDTTAAGDTFTGYFVAGLVTGMGYSEILQMCAKASSITVSRPGAVQSIPLKDEVNNF